MEFIHKTGKPTILPANSLFHNFSVTSASFYVCEDSCQNQAADRNYNALLYLFLTVKPKILPACAAFRLWKIMLKKVRLCEQKKIQTNDVKSLYSNPYDQKPQQETSETVFLTDSVNACIYNNSKHCSQQKNQYHTTENPLSAQRQVIQTWCQPFLHIFWEILCKSHILYPLSMDVFPFLHRKAAMPSTVFTSAFRYVAFSRSLKLPTVS